MNRKFFKILLPSALILHLFSGSAFAQPPQEDIDALLAELDWEMEDLTEYLEYYEESLDSFASAEELREYLGTPITPENLSTLLNDYELTREELDTLLADFGETLEDYKFIEDLEIAVGFYQDNDNMMLELENFLSDIGITEEEADRLFTHFESLDELSLEAEMEEIGARLESIMMMDPEAEITEEQKAEILAIWNEIMAKMHLSPKFYLVNADGSKTPISFDELADMEEFPASALFIELFDTEGNLILDLQVSADMLGDEYAIDAGEKLTDIGDLAGELTELRHTKLPDTASPYVSNMIIGVVIILAGLFLLLIRRKQILR